MWLGVNETCELWLDLASGIVVRTQILSRISRLYFEHNLLGLRDILGVVSSCGLPICFLQGCLYIQLPIVGPIYETRLRH